MYYSVLAGILPVGILELSAAGAGTWDADEGYTPGAGGELQAVLLTANPSTVPTVATFVVVYDDDANGTATATFTPPAYAPDQGEHMPQFIGVDLVPGNLAKTIKSITSLTSVVGGAPGVQIAIRQLPVAGDWIEIPDAVEKNITPGSVGSMAIAVGYDPAKYIKKGRGGQPSVSLSAKYSTAAVGLARLAGHTAAIMFVTRNDGATIVQRDVFSTVLEIDPPRSEGEVTVTGKGIATELSVFV